MYSTKRLQNQNPRGLQDCPSKRSNRFPQKTPKKRPKRPKRPQDRPKSSQCSPKPLKIILQNFCVRADSTIRYCSRILWWGHNQRLLMCSMAGMGFPTQGPQGPRSPEARVLGQWVPRGPGPWPHGSPEAHPGIPWAPPWDHGEGPWVPTGDPWGPWVPMGGPWFPMGVPGIPWVPMGSPGFPMG